MSLTAIIPAAGVGTRLRPHTHSKPKALLPVAGKPVLAHIIDQLVEVGVDRVVLVLGYHGEQIADWVAGAYPDLALDRVHQAERLGLGHAIFQALEQGRGGKGLREGRGLIVLGDTIVQADFAGLLAAPGHAMGVKEVADPRRFGVAVTEGDRIVDLEEKPTEPRSNLALVGLYAFRDLGLLHTALKTMIDADRRTRGEYQLTDALQWLIDSGEQLSPFPIEGWFDVGNAETWLATNSALAGGGEAETPTVGEGVILHPPLLLPASAVLVDCELGPNVFLGEGAEIHGSRVENSVVGSATRVTDSRLSDSLIGDHCEVASFKGRLNLGDHGVVSGEAAAKP
jgi:glucose-1-phosphate thymidylyltransferase